MRWPSYRSKHTLHREVASRVAVLGTKQIVHSNGTQVASRRQPTEGNYEIMYDSPRDATFLHRPILVCALHTARIYDKSNIRSGSESRRTEKKLDQCVCHIPASSPAGKKLPRTCPPLCRLSVETRRPENRGDARTQPTAFWTTGRQRARVAVAHDGREHQRIGADVRDDSVARRQQDRESRHCPGAYCTEAAASVALYYCLVVHLPPDMIFYHVEFDIL